MLVYGYPAATTHESPSKSHSFPIFIRQSKNFTHSDGSCVARTVGTSWAGCHFEIFENVSYGVRTQPELQKVCGLSGVDV